MVVAASGSLSRLGNARVQGQSAAHQRGLYEGGPSNVPAHVCYPVFSNLSSNDLQRLRFQKG